MTNKDFKIALDLDFLPNTIYALNFGKNVTLLQFSLINHQETQLKFTYDSRYGVVINQLKQSEQYFDLNLQLGSKQSLYLTYDNDQLFITVGGLTYVDLIYKTTL